MMDFVRPLMERSGVFFRGGTYDSAGHVGGADGEVNIYGGTVTVKGGNGNRVGGSGRGISSGGSVPAAFAHNFQMALSAANFTNYTVSIDGDTLVLECTDEDYENTFHLSKN